MSTDHPLPPSPDEAFSAVPLGPPPLDDIPYVVPFRRRGWTLLAWLVILAIVGMHGVAANVRWPKDPTTAIQSDQQRRMEEVQFRYLVGASSVLKHSGQDIVAQSRELKAGSIDQRLRFVVLTGEVRGPDAALADIRELKQEKRDELAEEDYELYLTVLTRVYEDRARKQPELPSLTAEDRCYLGQGLGWAGELALHPADSPDTEGREALLDRALKTFAALAGVVGGLLVLGFTGFVGLVVFLILAKSGKLRSRVTVPSGTGGIYAETFALWLILFLVLSVGAALVPVDGLRFLLIGVAMLLGLTALAWPVLRGIPWRQVRQEIGWTVGPKPWLEVLLGFATYVAALPLMVVGLAMTVALMKLQTYLLGADTPPPSHPIGEALGRGDWGLLLQVLFVASVVAPIVEETLFRGVLYRHLREASRRLGTLRSILVSATVVSFVFAVIHPQGLVAVPVLMALAFAFTLAREWRGSLVPAMIAHGLSNGIVLLVATLLLGI